MPCEYATSFYEHAHIERKVYCPVFAFHIVGANHNKKGLIRHILLLLSQLIDYLSFKHIFATFRQHFARKYTTFCQETNGYFATFCQKNGR